MRINRTYGYNNKPRSTSTRRSLTGVTASSKVTPMTKTQVYLPDDDLKALHATSKRTGRSVASLIREAVQRVWLRPEATGPVALWDGPIGRPSSDHDSIYDAP